MSEAGVPRAPHFSFRSASAVFSTTRKVIAWGKRTLLRISNKTSLLGGNINIYNSNSKASKCLFQNDWQHRDWDNEKEARFDDGASYRSEARVLALSTWDFLIEPIKERLCFKLNSCSCMLEVDEEESKIYLSMVTCAGFRIFIAVPSGRTK